MNLASTPPARTAFHGPRRPRQALLLMATLALSACTFAPDYVRPDAPIATDYPDLATATGSTAPLPDWTRYFSDPDLQAVIQTALDNNRDLRLAVGRVEEARALYGIQRADQLPSVGATAELQRSRTPYDLSVTGRSITSSAYQVTLGISTWELDFWGRVRNLKDAALENFLASAEAQRATQVSLIAQVANTYLLNRELDERLSLAQQSLATRVESLRIMQRRYEVGSSSELDVSQTAILMNQARLEVAGLQRTRQQARNALTLVVGTPITPQQRPLSELEYGFAQALPPGLPSALLTQRPDIAAAEHQLKAAHANIGAARAAFLPNVSLTGGYGSASAELDGLFDSDSSAWSFVPQLSLPIFTAGRLRANLDLAEVRRDIAVANYEKTIQAAFRDVADALADRRWLAEQVGILQDTRDAQAERARLANLRYDNGAATYLQVLDAERERFAVEQSLVETRRSLLASAVSLYAALGGGATPVTPSPSP